jgi:hypothetical protein
MNNTSPIMTLSRFDHMNKANEYQTKAEHCYSMAKVACTEFEKQSWLELADDWIALAKESKELAGSEFPISENWPLAKAE